MSKWILGAVATTVGAFFASQAMAAGPSASKTAQGIMVNLKGGGNFVLQQTQQWRFDEDTAATFFTNAQSGPPTCSDTGQASCVGATPPPAPAPDANKTAEALRANICTFFAGGSLAGLTYTQRVGAINHLTWTFPYSVTPNPASVPEHTAWVAGPINGPDTANVVFTADIAGESVVANKQNPLGKYSFSLLNGDGSSRVTGLQLTVTDASLATIFSATPTSAVNFPVEFNYTTNAGMNGTTTLLKNGDDFGILASDTFAGNDGGGADGSAAALASMQGVQVGLGAGSYTVSLTGTVKDNVGSSNLPFDVTSNLKIQAQRCTP